MPDPNTSKHPSDLAGRDLLTALQTFETSLHQPEVRNDAARLDRLLHQEFQEIGRSGTRYTREEVLRDLGQASEHPTRRSEGFVLNRISDDAALLTYRSVEVEEDDILINHAFRSSVWKRTPLGWQMLFHQGTPAAPFAS